MPTTVWLRPATLRRCGFRYAVAGCPGCRRAECAAGSHHQRNHGAQVPAGSVAGQGMALTGIGVAVGLAGALGLSRLLDSLLFGISATDPVAYAVAVGIFGIVAL